MSLGLSDLIHHAEIDPEMLLHYKMLRYLRQMRRTQMSRIDSMEVYLKTYGPQLVCGE